MPLSPCGFRMTDLLNDDFFSVKYWAALLEKRLGYGGDHFPHSGFSRRMALVL
jgi:hypothetical protein